MNDSRRTMLERARAIFELIKQENSPFPKSKLKDIGFGATSAESWLDLIVYIQSQPKIRLIKSGRIVLVEKVEE
ncbi:MAG: hypothetical protein ACFFC7_04720 [Candidatus Hermodarchaeota archaeon]